MKLLEKLKETRPCTKGEDVVIRITFGLCTVAAGVWLVLYKRLENESKRLENENKRLENERDIKARDAARWEIVSGYWKDDYADLENDIKDGIVYTDGKWYKTVEKPNYGSCLDD